MNEASAICRDDMPWCVWCSLHVLCLLLAVPVVQALNNGVGHTPAMGWNSWNALRCESLNETAVLEVAHAMVNTGLRDAGAS